MLMIFLLCFLLGFLELVFLFKFLTHFQFTFVYGISKGLISLCCIWISSFLSTICWRLSFSFVYSCLPCQRLVFHCRTVLKKSVILVYIQVLYFPFNFNIPTVPHNFMSLKFSVLAFANYSNK